MLLLALLPKAGLSQACDPPIARVISAQGTVEARRANQAQWVPVALDDRFCAGDAVRVQALSRAALALQGETVIRLDQNTAITFPEPKDSEKKTWLEVLEGVMHVISRDPRALRVITPFANAGIEGTEFLVTVTGTETSVLVLEGKVNVQGAGGGSAVALAGEQVTAGAGGPPVSVVVVRPRDAVQWTLYYPPILATSAGAGDAASSFEAMGKVAESDRGAAWHLQRASLLLSVGRQDEAQADIDAALKRDPKAGLAHALRAIIHVVRNEIGRGAGKRDETPGFRN